MRSKTLKWFEDVRFGFHLLKWMLLKRDSVEFLLSGRKCLNDDTF